MSSGTRTEGEAPTSAPGAPAVRPLDAAGVALAVMCCALWGGNTVAVKFCVPSIPPLGCAGLRFAIGLPLIAGICRLVGQPLSVAPRWWWLVALNAALTVVQIGTFNLGTSLSQAGRASVLINVHPLAVAPLAWLLLGERMGQRGCIGLLAAAGGVALLLSDKFQGRTEFLGDLIVLASGLLFAFQTIVQKRTFERIPPTTLQFTQSVLAIPLFLLLSGLMEGYGSYRFTPVVGWGLLYQGLIVTGIGFTTWLVLLRRYPAGSLATIAFLTPLFGIALGHLLRGERLTWPLIAGAALVGAGIYLVASDRLERGEPSDLVLPGEDGL